MKALVVYESMFGSTGAIARAVADGLEAGGFDVNVADVRTRPSIGDNDVLIVGAMTHAFSLSRPGTRADAARRGAITAGATEACRL